MLLNIYQNNLFDNTKYFYEKFIIKTIFFIFYITFNVVSYASSNYAQHQIFNNSFSINKSIYVYSDELDIHFYDKKIQLSGNVNIKQDHSTLLADKLIISYNENIKLLCDTIHAYGHVNYNSNYIAITSAQALINLNNKNIDFYQGTYHLLNSPVHGNANSIIQRKNNRYTILKQGKCTSCIINDDYWNITGSQMIYDRYKQKLDIWNACIRIKKIPIFYSPFFSISLKKDSKLKQYIPTIKYSSKNGLEFKIPYPIINNVSKYYSGIISPCYSAHSGITLETQLNYFLFPGKGSLILHLNNNKKLPKKNAHNKKEINKFWQLYWNHKGFMNKYWHFNADYLSSINSNNNIKNVCTPKYSSIHNNTINQKILCSYNKETWNANLAYLGFTGVKDAIKKQYPNYRAAPQLELNALCYSSNTQKQLFELKIFSQITQFIPTNYYFPKTIRIHLEPKLNFSIYNYWNNLNTEAKLKITHYQQNNINFYNLQHTASHLKHIINRIVPKFKINGQMVFESKKNLFNKYKHFLEPRIQYVYIPYSFQENIGIYDTSFIHRSYKNLFYGTTYSGLDRIAPMHQIIGDITFRYFNKIQQKELCYISIGQVFDIINYNYKSLKIIRCRDKEKSNNTFFLSTGYFNINKNWHMNSEIYYHIYNHIVPFGNIILEYVGNNNQVSQIQYKYLNKKYLKCILPHCDESIYHNTISQLGILNYFPIIDSWNISISHYYNLKNHKSIDQAIGIQYYTPCWSINMEFERNIIDWIKLSNRNIYDNKIKLNIRLYNSLEDCQSNPYKMLKTQMFPYQKIHFI
ncbi:LPS assembly protein LptD [Candidatus Blochmannia ocreatus (nom. nud.)]|uniref:LPS-assembly protein LptD n=1 Tax=Candidatus Blochmannia ocreatus (nom. nud.) TaxID=251538 RepID=A0ABY4SZ31_9ENTR|nr:LPS assembly protein LptD [Candidatus Blochmannia ocreatus]URJ25212.1 LPS assembly protein LptD [Candidatus Blochmannia ocreatus]